MRLSTKAGHSRLTQTPVRALLLAASALVILVPSLGVVGLAQRSGGASNGQPPPVRWERSHDFDVQHYRIEVRLDWKTKSVAGETTITLRPFTDGLRELVLDAGAMTISSVRLGSGSALKYAYDGKRDLRIALDRPYAAGQDVSLTVAYTATPKRGLSFIEPTASDPSRPYQIWSSGESEDNHYWFPCYDYPNDRATSETIVTVDEPYQVISNGQLVSVDHDAAKKTATYHWKMEQPFSSYLISIVVGDFADITQTVDGIPVSSYVPKSRVEDARLSLGKIGDMVRFFSEKTGVKYPYPKYAQIAVRDFPGGLENISATTMTDSSIHDKRALLDVTSDDLISHELAHQWFGDLVTCRDWSALWLNEGFATYLADLYTEHDLGRDEMLYAVRKDQESYFNAWNRGDRRPIVTKRYEDPDELFDAYVYGRAGAVLHMLRSVLGDDAWWKAVHRYLEKNAYGVAETEDFRVAAEEATGQSLDWFFDEWMFRVGHPEYDVSYSYDEAARTVIMTVKQTQKPITDSPYPVAGLFRMPVDVAITTSTGEHVERVWVEKDEERFSFKVDGPPLIVNFDRGNTLIKSLKFQKAKDELIYQALHDPDVMGRLWAVDQLKPQRADDVTRALGEVLGKDAFWGVRVEAAEALGAFQSEAAKTTLLVGVKDSKSAVRRAALAGLAPFKDAALADLFVGIIDHDESYYAIAEAERALGATKSPRAYDVLFRMLSVPSDRDVVRAAAFDGLAALGDGRALSSALTYATSPGSTSVRSAALQAAVAIAKDDPASHEKVLDLLLKTLASGPVQLKFAAIGALGHLGDPRAIPALAEAAAHGLDGRAEADSFFRRYAQRTLDTLRAKQGDQKTPAASPNR